MAETLNALRGLAQTLRSYAGSPVLSLDLSHTLDCAAEELGRRAEPVGEPVMTDIRETLAEAEDQLAMSAPGSSALDSVKRLVSRLAVPPEAQEPTGDVEALIHNLRLAEGWLLTGMWKDAQGHTAGEVAGWLDSAVAALRTQEPRWVSEQDLDSAILGEPKGGTDHE